MSFPEYWKVEGIGEEIDRKNRWSLFFKIDKAGMKAAMREIWNDALKYGDQDEIEAGSFTVSQNNSHLNVG